MPRMLSRLGCVAATIVVASGCREKASPVPAATTASVSVPAAPAPRPPFQPFKLEPWRSHNPKIAPVSPPEDLLIPFRFFVNQERPRQKKNPVWRTIPPKEAVELPMEPDAKFRCIVNPLVVKGRPDEEYEAVAAWVLTRSVLCSSDGWSTWGEWQHQVVVTPDGKRTPTVEQTDILLREARAGHPRETVVLVRSDEEAKGDATTGPPKAAPHRAGDEP